MRKPEQIESQRGFQRLEEEIEAFADALEPLARIEAFTRVMKRYRAVIARTCGVRSESQQLAKDVYGTLSLIAKVGLWMEMWRAECALLGGTRPAQTRAILREFPAYLDEMRRVLPLLRSHVAAQRARARARTDLYHSSACYTAPSDPGRRGPRIDLTIEPIEDESADEQQRTLILHISGRRPSDAQKLKEALLALPGVYAVQMKSTNGWRREAKRRIPDWRHEARYSIQAAFTAADLARLLANGLRGIAFGIRELSERRIEAWKR